jgi:hypothetical protein
MCASEKCIGPCKRVKRIMRCKNPNSLNHENPIISWVKCYECLALIQAEKEERHKKRAIELQQQQQIEQKNNKGNLFTRLFRK